MICLNCKKPVDSPVYHEFCTYEAPVRLNDLPLAKAKSYQDYLKTRKISGVNHG